MIERYEATVKLGKALKRFLEFDGCEGELLASVLVEVYGSHFVLWELISALKRRADAHPNAGVLLPDYVPWGDM